jgi:hypothetical protein
MSAGGSSLSSQPRLGCVVRGSRMARRHVRGSVGDDGTGFAPGARLLIEAADQEHGSARSRAGEQPQSGAEIVCDLLTVDARAVIAEVHAIGWAP